MRLRSRPLLSYRLDRMKRVALIACLTFATCPAVTAVAAAQTAARRLTFDVASIRPSQPGQVPQIMKPLPKGTGYMVQNMSVKAMMSVAYRLPLSRIEGGPDWFDTDRYDVEAKAERSYSLDDLHTMFKNLLADRFGLKFHMVTREGSVYNLVVDKGGPKMKPDGPPEDMQVPVVPRGPGNFVGTKVRMSYLCFFLGQQIPGAERPVIDKTGLTQSYDFTLTFVPEFPGVPTEKLAPELQNRPALFDAVRQQLGLRLEAAKGTVDSYMVDTVQRPSEN